MPMPCLITPYPILVRAISSSSRQGCRFLDLRSVERVADRVDVDRVLLAFSTSLGGRFFRRTSIGPCRAWPPVVDGTVGHEAALRVVGARMAAGCRG